MMRYRGLAAFVTLVALAFLVLRPAVLDAVGIPYGVPGSNSFEIVRAEGSAHCEMLSDCYTVSIANNGLNLDSTSLLPALAGAVLVVGLRLAPRLQSRAVPVANPPPVSIPA